MIQCFKFIDYREATNIVDKLNQITGADSKFHSLETIGDDYLVMGTVTEEEWNSLDLLDGFIREEHTEFGRQ